MTLDSFAPVKAFLRPAIYSALFLMLGVLSWRQCRDYRDIETLIVDHPVPQKKGLAFYGRLAANLLSSLPYSVASHRSLPMRRAVEEYAASHHVAVGVEDLMGNDP